MITKIIITAAAFVFHISAAATAIGDFQFKSPAFTGSGYGTYVLTIENEQYTRSQALLAALLSAQTAAAAAAQSKPINQFLTNLESRIYAQVSQNVATAMFANGACAAGASACGGSINFQGNTLSWLKDPTNPTNILLTVSDNVGNVTVINVPLGSFNMTAP